MHAFRLVYIPTHVHSHRSHWYWHRCALVLRPTQWLHVKPVWPLRPAAHVGRVFTQVGTSFHRQARAPRRRECRWIHSSRCARTTENFCSSVPCPGRVNQRAVSTVCVQKCGTTVISAVYQYVSTHLFSWFSEVEKNLGQRSRLEIT